jgi:hypothetical protein
LKGNTFEVGAEWYGHGSKRRQDFDFMAGYEIRNNGSKQRYIRDLIFQI